MQKMDSLFSKLAFSVVSYLVVPGWVRFESESSRCTTGVQDVSRRFRLKPRCPLDENEREFATSWATKSVIEDLYVRFWPIKVMFPESRHLDRAPVDYIRPYHRYKILKIEDGEFVCRLDVRRNERYNFMRVKFCEGDLLIGQWCFLMHNLWLNLRYFYFYISKLFERHISFPRAFLLNFKGLHHAHKYLCSGSFDLLFNSDCRLEQV